MAIPMAAAIQPRCRPIHRRRHHRHPRRFNRVPLAGVLRSPLVVHYTPGREFSFGLGIDRQTISFLLLGRLFAIMAFDLPFYCAKDLTQRAAIETKRHHRTKSHSNKFIIKVVIGVGWFLGIVMSEIFFANNCQSKARYLAMIA